MESARIGILGPLQVHAGDEAVAVNAPQLRRLLAVLAVAGGRPASTGSLAESLWPEDLDDPERPRPRDAATTVRSYTSRLRALLPGSAGPHRDARGYRLDMAHVDLDADRFENLLSAAAAELPNAPDWALATLTSALELWRGPALAEFRDEPWATGAAVRLDELRLVAVERAGEARLAIGDHEALASELAGLVVAHPFRERLWAQLTLALYRSGRQADALRAVGRLREMLVEELGVDPGRELVDLEAAVLRQDPSLLRAEANALISSPARPAAAAAAGSGTPPAAPATALASSGAPAGASAPRDPLVRNLAPERTSFVGRAAELDALCRALGVDSPLLTVVGPGGTGKTRLAAAAARLTAARFGHAFLVALAGTTSGLVGDAVAEALGIQVPAGMRATDAVVGSLAPDALVLLDNCEHLVREVAELVDEVLDRCPRVVVLATSREPLLVRGETVFRLAPLGLPTDDGDVLSAARQSEAAALFVQRGAQARHGFALDEHNAAAVAAVCCQVDGIPLALELAAARLGSLSVEQLSAALAGSLDAVHPELRGGEPRQRTMRGAIDWSHDLLSEEERICLRRLSVLRGGFDLDGAVAVAAGNGLAAADVPQALASLVQQSMAETDLDAGPRYRLLEPVRQYAAWQLEQACEAVAARTAHLVWCRALVQPMRDGGLRGPGAHERLAQLDRELDNLRAAVRFAIDAGLALESAEIVTSLRGFWTLRAHYNEAAAYCGEILAMTVPLPARARTLELRAKIATYRDADEATAREIDSVIEMFAETGDSAGLALARYERARIGHGNEPVAVRRANWALVMAVLEPLGDAIGIADVHQHEAWLSRGEGDIPRARQEMAAVLEEYRRLQDAQGTAMALEALGIWELEAGELEPAGAHLEEAYAAMAKLGFRQSMARLGVELGELVANRGDLEQAGARCAAAVYLYRELGATNGYAWALERLAVVEELRRDFAEARPHFEQALALYLSLSSSQEAANCAAHLGRLALRGGDLRQAATRLTDAFDLLAGPSAEEDLVANCLVTTGELAARAGEAVVWRSLVGAGVTWRRRHGMADLPVELRGWASDGGQRRDDIVPGAGDDLSAAVAEARELLRRLL